MTDRRLVSSFTASSLIHIALISIATVVMQPEPIAPTPIPIEILNVPPLEQPKNVEVTPLRRPPLPKPKPHAKAPDVTAPKLVSKPEIIEPKPQPPAGNAKEEIKEPKKPIEEPPRVAGLETFSLVQGGWNIGDHSGESEVSDAGAGNLFGKGDVGAVGGSGGEGDGGGQGLSGLGREAKGDGTGGGGGGSGEALSGLARPLGGYRVKPRYPEAARRAGAEGITILKVNVLKNGRVGEVLIEKSAGFRELDLSAMEAVEKWLFEPARRGKESVAVWVLLPIHFELR